MALVTISRLRCTSASPTAMAKKDAIAHLVTEIVQDFHSRAPHRPDWMDDARLGVQPDLHRFITACGSAIVGFREPNYQVPAYVGKNWKPILQRRRPCVRCTATRRGDYTISIGQCYPDDSGQTALFG